MFGRGQREELDDEEADELVRVMRVELKREVARIQKDEGVVLSHTSQRVKL